MRLKDSGSNVYELRFDVDTTNGIFETDVARNAMGLRPHSAEMLGLGVAERIRWNSLATRVIASYQQYPNTIAVAPVEPGEIARPLTLEASDLQRLGQGLLYYYDTTADAEHLMVQQGQPGPHFALRSEMAFVALEMCEVLDKYVDIPEPTQKTQALVVGFALPTGQ